MTGRCGLVVVAFAAALAGCADRRQPAYADGRVMVIPGSLSFGRVALHDSHELEVTLHNVGRSRTNVTRVTVEGDPDGAYQADLCAEGERELLPGGTCQVKVHFAPLPTESQKRTPKGERERDRSLAAKLVVYTDSLVEPQVQVPLVGVGVDTRVAISAEELQFGRIEAQSTKKRSLTFKNETDLTIEVIPHPVGPDGDEFTVPPLTLQGFESKEVEVLFAPERVGKKDAHLSVSLCAGCEELPVGLVAEALDRAVIAEPWELDFGQVPVDREAHRKTRLHNISTEPMTVTGLSLDGNTDVSFTFAPDTFPFVLQPDERREFDLRYGPAHEGDAAGKAVFGVVSVRNPTTEVPLRGVGGTAELCVSLVSSPDPNEKGYWFGDVPVGGKVSTLVSVRNCGADHEHPLLVQEVTFGGDNVPGEDEFHAAPGALPRPLKAGEEMLIKVTFEPTREGLAGGYLRIKSSAFNANLVRVAFNGNAVVQANCNLSITPQAIDFGTVPPRAGAVLGIRVENRGSDLCAVKNIQIADGAPQFSLPGGDIDGLTLYPGDYFTFQVAFVAPAAGGQFHGAVQIESADPHNPRFLVPLVANSQDSCLVATPPYLDFGRARPDCPVPALAVRLLNQCAQPVTLNGVAIGPGTSDGEFVLDGTSEALPRQLAPGDAVTVRVRYLGLVHGMNLSPLYADVTGIARPLLVPLLGESSTRLDQTDVFVQQDGSKVDVLFVVDNTESMLEEQPRLNAALPAFADAALRRGVDLHVAFTTTGIDPVSSACPGGAQGGEAGRFFPADNTNPRILTQRTADLAGALQRNADVGRCAFVEQGLEAVRRALSSPLVDHADDRRTPLPNDGNLGFLRSEAALAVVFVGDEDDHSPDDVDTYVRFIQSVKGLNQPQRAVVYAIAPTEQACSTAGGRGTRYAEAARKTGGGVMSICSPDYAPLLRDVADKAFSPQDRFTLSAPAEANSIHVFVDGTELVGGWHYDAAGNAVVFDTRPAAGARIELRYRKSCGA